MTSSKCSFVRFPTDKLFPCNLGYLSNVGQVFLILPPVLTSEIDEEISQWTSYYSNNSIEYLKFRSDRPIGRMVVAVDRAANQITRGVLYDVDETKGQAILDLVDLGEMRPISIKLLYEATPEVVNCKWKTLPCVLDGMNIFMGSDLLLEALRACSDDLKSSSLSFCVKDWSDAYAIVELVHMTPTSVTRINEKIFDFIDNASTIRFTDSFRGMITNVTPDGQINIITEAKGNTSTPLELMDRFLERFSVKSLLNVLPATTLENVDMAKIYVAEYVEDGKLYRAKVLDVDSEKVQVQFMDYGNIDTIEYSKLFLALDLDPSVARLRALGTTAYLKSVKTVLDVDKVFDILAEKCWVVDAHKEFRNYEQVVSLFDPDSGNVVNQILLSEGLASKT